MEQIRNCYNSEFVIFNELEFCVDSLTTAYVIDDATVFYDCNKSICLNWFPAPPVIDGLEIY